MATDKVDPTEPHPDELAEALGLRPPQGPSETGWYYCDGSPVTQADLDHEASVLYYEQDPSNPNSFRPVYKQ